MTLLFFDGFENGTQVVKPEWLLYPAPGGAVGNPGIGSNSGARTGGGVLNAGYSNTLGVPGGGADKVTLGFAFWHNQSPYPNLPVVSIYGDGTTTNHLSLVLNASRKLELHLGAWNGPLLATSVSAIPLGAWRSIQVQVSIADAGGRCIVKVDNVTEIDFTGDTRNGGTSAKVTAFVLYGASSNLANSWYDDMWMCDGVDATATQGRANNDFLGDLKVSTLVPNAAGASTQWMPSTGANYTCVDELPANTTDYVTAAAAGLRDSYEVGDLPATAVAVYGLRVGAYAQKSDAGAASLKTLIRESGGSVTLSSASPLSTTWAGYLGSIISKNSGGSVLSVADVNSMQIGVESA